MERADIVCIIPAAGQGQRCRPLTSYLQKAMFPLGKIPLLEWSIRHAYDSGIRRFHIIVDYLSYQVEAYRDTLRSKYPESSFHFFFQGDSKGLGAAVSKGYEVSQVIFQRDTDPPKAFLILLPDEVFFNNPCDELILAYENEVLESGDDMISFGVIQIPTQAAFNYGVTNLRPFQGGRFFVEKPTPEQAAELEISFDSSLAACVGPYIFSSEVMDDLVKFCERKRKTLSTAEIGLTEFIASRNFRPTIFSRGVTTSRVDCGSLTGYMEAWDKLAVFEGKSS
jgi:UTP-glucose-1-phosphate uridylyltransferase